MCMMEKQSESQYNLLHPLRKSIYVSNCQFWVNTDSGKIKYIKGCRNGNFFQKLFLD